MGAEGKELGRGRDVHNQNKLPSDHICTAHHSQMHIVTLVIAPIKQQLHFNHKWTSLF